MKLDSKFLVATLTALSFFAPACGGDAKKEDPKKEEASADEKKDEAKPEAAGDEKADEAKPDEAKPEGEGEGEVKEEAAPE
jgi:hypothetical protein